MKDFSFIRLKNSFSEAKNINGRLVNEIFYYDYIQLSPLEAYTQITNVDGGISFDGHYKVEVIDCSDNVLQDITPNVFIEEFTGVNGNTQLKFEIINIIEDYYRRTVYLKFSSTLSNDVYYSNPLNITDYQKEQTTFFQYKSYYNYKGIGYQNAQCYQSIRLKTYFDIPIDESEIQNYFQISTNNEISSRVLDKQYERYQIDYIHRFGFDNTNVLLKSDIIYLDTIRVTNKAFLDSNEMQGNSNVFDSGFTISKNYDDVLSYTYQIFDGLQLLTKSPLGSYTLVGLPTDITGSFNYPIDLGTGTLTVHDANDNSILATYTESDINVVGNTFTIDNTGVITENGSYYIMFSSGLFSYIGIDFEGINNSSDWAFTVQDGDYSELDYSNDYLTA